MDVLYCNCSSNSRSVLGVNISYLINERKTLSDIEAGCGRTLDIKGVTQYGDVNPFVNKLIPRFAINCLVKPLLTHERQKVQFIP
jgi:hypothetical protein